ncbi:MULTISPECIES: gephyrin-like molybdotransferase Glp [Lysinibacillus]|uniref:molybdopterin molybdotransferase MoeA n=1 Tax=Lysinibacillus TaxID=400634 RepID=UPI00214C30B0|nr:MULTISPECIES: gephyrin-like molybdotransferase Glp [Lysinibacillus]UUV27269.1 molybdopterin molybdotransferase MoeA [Lysinibacillus sp. FN11]UYB45537.1 molybdopterin molybdotransferase MoeA [Lysinibacillus capsici]
MVEKRQPIPVAEAVHRVMDYAFQAKKEHVPLTQAHGRFIAQAIRADHDVPAFDRSPYDGYAIRSIDSQEASSQHPVRFQVVGEIGAGYVYDDEVGDHQAVRIMTGAPIPQGCDAVVMLELTHTFEENHQKYMSIKRPFEAGTNISYKGEDVQQGAVLIEQGQTINPGVMALLATFGYEQVPVYRKKVIGVLATGSELLEPGESLQPGKIRNSNAYMIMAQIERAGAEVKYFGKFSDDLALCIDRVEKALQEVDILITTGGVSVGDYDYLPAIYEAINAKVLFNKIAMRPGSVTTVAARNDKLLFGLSGNPSACYVGFELFVRPIIRSAYGHTQPHLRREQAILGADFTKPNPFTRFVRARIDYEKGQLVTVPSGFDKSSAVSSLATANAFIVLPGGSRGYEKGMQVDVLLLEDLQGSEWPWDNIEKSYR